MYAQFAAESASSAARRVVEIGAQLAELAALAEERPEALLVAPPLGEDLLAPLALEVAPLAREDRRDVELLGDDAEMARAARGGSSRPPGSSSGIASSAAWKASAPSRIASKSRSCFESIYA